MLLPTSALDWLNDRNPSASPSPSATCMVLAGTSQTTAHCDNATNYSHDRVKECLAIQEHQADKAEKQ